MHVASRLFLALFASRATMAAFTTRRVVMGSADATQLEAALPAAQYVFNLTETVPRSASKTKALQHLSKRVTGKSDLAVLSGSAQDEEYITSVTFGNQAFKAIVGEQLRMCPRALECERPDYRHRKFGYMACEDRL
jgi:hypothetical protein